MGAETDSAAPTEKPLGMEIVDPDPHQAPQPRKKSSLGFREVKNTERAAGIPKPAAALLFWPVFVLDLVVDVQQGPVPAPLADCLMAMVLGASSAHGDRLAAALDIAALQFFVGGR